MSDWKEIQLRDIISVRGGFSYKGEYIGSGTALLLGMGCVSNKEKFLMKGARLYSGEYSESYLAKPGDIILATRQQSDNLPILGMPAMIPDTLQSKIVIVGTNLYMVNINSDNITNLFLFWLLKSQDYQYHIYQCSSGTTVRMITKDSVESYKFLLPTLPEQRAIAAVLSSLDEKIDLLHHQNKTLEAIAETLFKKWFVEEANSEWNEVNLGYFFPVKTGKKDANFGTVDGPYPFFTCSQLPIKAPSYSFDGSAILLSGNGDFNVKRYIGKFEAYQRTYVLMPYDSRLLNFLFILMKYFLNEITGGYKGSVINFITKGMIADFKFSLPSDGIKTEQINQFDKIYNKVDANTRQITSLESLRDTLLPKLMSGEVRVEV